MKRLLLLLAVACVGLASCSDSATLASDDPDKTPSQLETPEKRFDFSEVDTDGLEIKTVYEAQDGHYDVYAFEYAHPDLAVVVGEINSNLWLGLFDRESGKLKYQYTDIEHPLSYLADGVEHEYGMGCVYGIYFENNDVVIAIKYSKRWGEARLDLITFDVPTQKAHRTIITENLCYDESKIRTIGRWKGNTVCLCFPILYGNDGSIIYDIKENKTICFVSGIALSFHYIIVCRMMYVENNVLISDIDLLHSWMVRLGEKLLIEEFRCTYDTVTAMGENITLFDPYTGNSSQAPRYSVEYQTRTDDHISAVVTQTEYDGTITTKTVDVRVENDELKVDIQ